jgi:hypothetical protein
MIEILDRTLKFRLGAAREVDKVQAPTEASTEIDFAAYSGDCRLFGRLVLQGERLTDMLNVTDELLLVDVMVESLEDGHILTIPELTLPRDELLVVEVNGPRGNPGRRQHLQALPISATLGPYVVTGYVHVHPGADAMEAIKRRGPMVPLTDAVVSYQCNSVMQRRQTVTLLFNRELADSISSTSYDGPVPPDLRIAATGVLAAKDFTNEVHEGDLSDPMSEERH